MKAISKSLFLICVGLCASCGAASDAEFPCSFGYYRHKGIGSCIREEYRCVASDKGTYCGSQILVRECTSLVDCDEWKPLYQCRNTERCHISHYGPECPNDFDCPNPVIHCTSGPCCENNHFKRFGTICRKEKRSRCIGLDACDAKLSEKDEVQYCNGFSAECVGSIAYTAPIEKACGEGEACISTSKTEASCKPCPLGCKNQKCSTCNSGLCCDTEAGEFYPAGTECNLRFGYYCEPAGYGGTAVAIKSHQACDSEGNCIGPWYTSTHAKQRCMPNQSCQASASFVECH